MALSTRLAKTCSSRLASAVAVRSGNSFYNVMCLAAAGGFRSLKDFFNQRAQRDGLQVQFHPPGFQRGNRQQILDEQVQPLRVALDDFEEARGDFGIAARAVEQCFDVAFDERERRAQFVADVGDEFLARAFELLEPRQVVKHQNRAFAFAGGIGNGGGVDLQPALAQFRQFQFVVENLFFSLDALDESGQFVDAQRLHDGFPAQLGLDAEQIP